MSPAMSKHYLRSKEDRLKAAAKKRPALLRARRELSACFRIGIFS
jgi:hypothetical protein